MFTTAEGQVVGVSTTSRMRLVSKGLSAATEGCWFFVALVLFMILGPFAAPFAVAAIFIERPVDECLLTPETEVTGKSRITR